MTNVKAGKRDRRDVISPEEFREMLRQQEKAREHPYHVIRDKALLCLLWKTGKRASEVAAVERRGVEVDREARLLRITFQVLKKRTDSRLETRRTKAIRLEDPYAEPVLEYHRYMEESHPGCVYLFPSLHYSPLTGQVTLYPESHITRMTVHNIVTLTELGRRVWPHLFRETQGAKVVRRYGNTVTGAFAVKQRLDLKKADTALRYVERYASDLILPDQDQDQEDTVDVTEPEPEPQQ